MGENLPLAVEIEINSDCNLSCAYCPNSKSERIEKGHMPLETFKKIMLQLQQYNYAGRISYHFYNEPTLSPNLNLFVRMTKEHLPKAKTILYSNGTNLDKNKIDALYADGLDRFVITEHHQAKLHNLDFISDDKSIYTTNRFKFSTFKQIPMTNRAGAVKAGARITEPLNTPCFIPRCVLVITLKGNVVACYEDYFQHHVMGNIHEQDIMSIWNSEKYVHFRNELKLGNRHKFEACKNCNNQLIIV
ncbi:SPASM domain-containing protein [bacterium]|nr:SPASM domain-containing protein [bacterium]